MARKSLVGMVADELLDRIIKGEFPPGSAVPGELELSALHDVSRMTVREAIKTLEAQRILSVERGRGTFVNPLKLWASLEAVLRAASVESTSGEAALHLIELRRMLETGACELAASRISKGDVDSLFAHLSAMRAASAINDVGAFVEADLAFHDVILHASGNIFVAVLFDPLRRLLEVRRAETSAIPAIQQHAIRHHQNIAEALQSGDAVRARQTMDDHMQQTMNDLKELILGALASPEKSH